MSKKNPAAPLARLRALVRPVLLQSGTALAPGGEVHDRIDTIVDDEAKHRRPTVSRESEALVRRIEHGSGEQLARAVSDHFGAIMVAYSEAGYFVGVAVGCELAALILGVSHPAIDPKGGRR